MNAKLWSAANELAPSDVEFEVEDISKLPMFSSDLTDPEEPAEVVQGQEPAMPSSWPESANYSVTPLLKNAIDWCVEEAERAVQEAVQHGKLHRRQRWRPWGNRS